MGYLNVDFGHRRIRLLEAEGTAKKLKLRSFRIVDTSREGGDIFDDPEAARAASNQLGRVLSSHKFSREPSSMALDSSSCFVRDLVLPFKGTEQINKVIKYEVEGHIQQDLDDIVVGYFKKSETIDKSNLMVMAARKDELRRQLEFLDTARIDPLYIDLDVMCFYNALSGTGIVDEHDSFIVINFGRDATSLLVIDKKRLVSTRSIPLGVGSVAAALEFDLKKEEIEEEGSEYGLLGLMDCRSMTDYVFGEGIVSGDVPAPGEPAEGGEEIVIIEDMAPGEDAGDEPPDRAWELASRRLNDFFAKLRREIVRVLTFLETENRPEKLYLTGVGCRIPGVKKLIQSIFNVEAEELDFLSRVEHSFTGDEAMAINHEVGVALGLAFKQTGHDATRVDLRQEEMRYAKKFDQVKVPLACLTFLLLIMVTLLNLQLIKQRNCKQKEMDYIQDYVIDDLNMVLKDPNKAKAIAMAAEPGRRRVERVRRALEDINKELLDKLGRGGTIEELPSVFPVWHALFAAIQNNQKGLNQANRQIADDKKIEVFKLAKLKIETLKSKPDLIIDGEVGSGADYSNLLRALAEVPGFAKVERGDDRKAEDSDNRMFSGIRIELDLDKLED